MSNAWQKAVGAGALVLAGALAAGASQIRGEAGYAGVGPAFLPWAMAAALALCGAALLVQAFTGGLRKLPEPPEIPPYWRGMAWVSAGLLLNAALITRIGFIASCTLLFVLAYRGFRLSMGHEVSAPSVGRSALVGAALSAPVYWMFTKLLGLTLPGLTATGWI